MKFLGEKSTDAGPTEICFSELVSARLHRAVRQGPNNLTPCFKLSSFQQRIGKFGIGTRDFSGSHIGGEAVLAGLLTGKGLGILCLWGNPNGNINGHVRSNIHVLLMKGARLPHTTARPPHVCSWCCPLMSARTIM